MLCEISCLSKRLRLARILSNFHDLMYAMSTLSVQLSKVSYIISAIFYISEGPKSALAAILFLLSLFSFSAPTHHSLLHLSLSLLHVFIEYHIMYCALGEWFLVTRHYNTCIIFLSSHWLHLNVREFECHNQEHIAKRFSRFIFSSQILFDFTAPALFIAPGYLRMGASKVVWSLQMPPKALPVVDLVVICRSQDLLISEEIDSKI